MTVLNNTHKQQFDENFTHRASLAWEDLSPPDEFDLSRLKKLMWGVIERIGIYPTSIMVDNDFSGCVVYYWADVFIGCADESEDRVSVRCSSNEEFSGSFIGPLSISDEIISYIQSRVPDQPPIGAVNMWAPSPDSLEADAKAFKALSPEEPAGATAVLKTLPVMMAAFDHDS